MSAGILWGQGGDTEGFGWGPPGTPGGPPVPEDLGQYYRQAIPNGWGYVCPCCKHVWAPGWGGMPAAFRAHLRPYFEGRGCFFAPAVQTGKP